MNLNLRVFKEKQIIISNDLDGLVCAAFLSSHYKCQVVGVYTLENLWIAENHFCTIDELLNFLKKCIFVDHDIFHPEILSIGHHILQWCKDLPAKEIFKKIINPNLEKNITFKNFNQKYPFATIHLLLSFHKGEVKFTQKKFLTLLLHIDSSFINAMKYQENALEWISWLEKTKEGPIHSIFKVLHRRSTCALLRDFEVLSKDFMLLGLKPRGQAVFSDPLKENRLIQKFYEYLREISGWYARFPLPEEFYKPWELERKSDKPTKKNFKKILKTKPFSYALISKGTKGLNYAYLHGHNH